MTVSPAPAQTLASTISAPSSELLQFINPAMAGFWNLLKSAREGTGPQEGPPPQEGEQPPTDPPTEQELEALVARLELNPQGEVTLKSGQALVMEALPLDADGSVVQGLIAKWESDNARVVSVTRDGEAHAWQEGTAYLTASAGQKQASVRVNVVAANGVETLGTNALRTKRAAARLSSHAGGGVTSSRRRPRLLKHGASVIGAAPAPLQPTDVDPLPDSETSSLYSPTNAVGSPPGRTELSAAASPAAVRGREKAGSANFSFDVPLVSLPGRGIDVSLGLVYNSRLWNKSTSTTTGQNGVEIQTTHLSFDVDNGWPAGGWKLGYGQIESQGAAGFTLTEADGTRHEMTRLNPSNPQDNTYQSTDGTFVLYDSATHIATYTNGTRVEYGAGGTTGKRSYPIKVTDSNGNYILITYRNGIGPQLATIKDTLARYVRFNYDASGKLATITAPHYAGGADRQVARFYYQDLTLSKSFAAAINVTAPDTTSVIRYIYFPGTQNGYRYDYSAYGMIYNIAQQRGMTVDSTALTTTGTVTGEGQEAASTLYNYPTVAGNLSDVPKYTRRTDDWAGRTTASKPFYTFAVNEAQGLVTVTAPDGSVSETHAIVAEGEWNDGLVSEWVIRDGTNILTRTILTWENDASGRNPRVQKVETINEAGQSRTTQYSYTSYNNVSVVSERDWSAVGTVGSELRRKETTYETGTAWTSRRLVRLAKSIKVFKGGTATPASRVEYGYDTVGSNLLRRDDLIMHDDAFDPYSPTQTICDPDCHPFNPYDPATDKRGNVTSITTYSDAAAGTGAATDTFDYDIAGNLVAQTAACCQQKTYIYTPTYKYAYQTEESRGDTGQLVTKATYDFNTGVVRTATDENNQVTNIHYYPETLRHFKTISPDGGYTQHEYDDKLYPDPGAPRMHSYIKTTIRLDLTGTVERVISSYEYLDGRGAVARTFGPATPDGYVTTDIEYDQMGRAFRASNPYYTLNGTTDAVNPTGKWNKRTFDDLGRVTQATQTDNNTIQMSYAGDAVVVTDQAGKQRRQITDALGRVERADEPDAAGNLGTIDAPTQPTYYLYDVLDNPIKITQGAQRRYFKYDSLSRLTRERQVEQAAPHYDPDALTGNNYWSRKIVYNDDGSMTDSYDARQVRAHYDYDGLNRVTKITYSGEGSQTPSVIYTYDQAVGSFFNQGRLTQVQTKVGATVQTSEQYNYNRMGQVAQHTQTVNGTAYTTKYTYNLAGQLTKETYPNSRAVSYSYDDAARLARVADATRAYVSSFAYAPHGGILSETWGENAVAPLVCSMSYNTRLQPTQIKFSVGGVERQRFDYVYGEVDDATGTVDATKNTGQVGRVEGFIDRVKQWQQRYSYDELGNLALASEYPGTTTTAATYRIDYAHDRYGNRSQDGGQNSGLSYVRVRATDISASTNRFVSGVTYDAAGNITVDNKFRGRQYDYDVNGRQRWSADVDGSDPATAVYDGLGQRVEATAGGETRQFAYDAYGKLIAEYSEGAWQRDYVYRNGHVVATVEAAGVSYVLTDHQGSVRLVVNESGAVTARHDYLPFGEELQAGTGLRTTLQNYGAADGVRQRYALMEREAGSGLDHTWWRTYESSSGRWTSPDPYLGSMSVGDPQSFNRYNFVENDPVNFVDPTGLETLLVCFRGRYGDGFEIPSCIFLELPDPVE
ncbi:MAG TPA: RHS repeat-associated core domain-containing protein, partial [Pyrinomonadaceae bacterium]